MSMHSAGLFMAWKRRGSDRNLKWVPAENGDVPAGAVEVGRFGGRGGEFMYIGRVTLPTNDIIPGTVIPSKNACFVPWNGKEVQATSYEVLTNTQPDLCHLHWVGLTIDGQIPTDAVKAGYDTAAEELIYIARARPPGVVGTHVAKVRRGDDKATISYNGEEHYVTDFKILCRKLITQTGTGSRPHTA